MIFSLSDEDLVRQENAMHRAFIASVNRQKSAGELLMEQAATRRQQALAEARERLRAKGVDPDSL